MAPSNTHEVVVEFDGLWFRVQKLRGRRAFRGSRALQKSFGAAGYLALSNPEFWAADEDRQLLSLMALENHADVSYDEAEEALAELLLYSAGEGVSYRESPPDPERPDAGWVPVRSIDALDGYRGVDHTTWRALRWEMVKICYRPTSAAAGINDATPSAATTSTPASSPAGSPRQPQTGTPAAATKRSGISGG